MFKTIIVTGTALLMLALSATAADTKADEAVPAVKELKNQTNCPVMGGKIDSSSYTDIQGQRVYHCCPMCTAKLKADPDKYFKKAAEAGILFENIQTTCPVSGKKLEDKSVYSDFEGRRVVFCCDKCKTKFEKTPKKFLSLLDTKKETKSEENHSGHNH